MRSNIHVLLGYSGFIKMNAKPSRIGFTSKHLDVPVLCLHQVAPWLLIYSSNDAICQQDGDTPGRGLWVMRYFRRFEVLQNQSRECDCGVKVALKPYLTLSRIFARPKDPVHINKKTHAVCSLPSDDCENEYLHSSV